MSWRPEIPTGAGVGGRASPAVRGEAWRWRLVGRGVTDNPKRVRALGRATRSATRLSLSSSELTEPSAGLASQDCRRAPGVRLRIRGGGPGPLTEDR